MDVDTVSKKNSHEEILNKFKNENIDILIGTQMVVKGHHFPNVTLVGVIAADSSLNIDDYRASERTFQILTQVAGRAGREKFDGNVIIQTYNPSSFSIEYSKQQNYELFFNTEVALRKQLKYPPFCDIIVIGFNSIILNELTKVSNQVYNYIMNKLNRDKFMIFKPMPSPIDKIQNRHRWRIIIKGIMDEETNEILNNCLKEIYEQNLKSTRISIDVNPNNMM
ncbi:Primosomal protein N' [compost metagenome]